jgi:hypothetical protein
MTEKPALVTPVVTENIPSLAGGGFSNSERKCSVHLLRLSAQLRIQFRDRQQLSRSAPLHRRSGDNQRRYRPRDCRSLRARLRESNFWRSQPQTAKRTDRGLGNGRASRFPAGLSLESGSMKFMGAPPHKLAASRKMLSRSVSVLPSA